MVISNPDTVSATSSTGGNNGANSFSHPSGIPQDQIDNIMSGISNTGDVKMNNHRKKLRQRFDIIKKLGQGTYGKVQLGINKETGQEVAIKTIKKCKIEAEADLVRIRREVQIMSSVQHPNIIHIYEVFENREKMVLVMEFAAGGELYDYLSERKVLSEEEARRIFRQVATAVYYCHKHKICHRDLKLENILLDQDGNAKIADFGLSNVFDDQRLLATFCGSPLYASPEIVEGTPYQGPEVDCWSLGVLLYTLVYGSMPFDGSNFKRLVKQISQGDYYEPKKPSRASSLIRNMLTVCPRKRATIEQICSHWWVNEHDNMSCLDLAEDLANQTPVRLDVLLSLTPTAITADQLVVTSTNDGEGVVNGNERMVRSHSVGSIRDIPANTEAERKILDMVAAGGEAALMPSPTRTISPVQSPIQAKRKLQSTVSTENVVGTTKKKEMPVSNKSFTISESKPPLKEKMIIEMEGVNVEEPKTTTLDAIGQKQQHRSSQIFSHKDMELVGDLCEQLIQENSDTTQSEINVIQAPIQRHVTASTLDSVKEIPEEKNATKVIKKFVHKHKTADLVNALNQVKPSINEQRNVRSNSNVQSGPTFIRKCSLQDDTSLTKFNAERRKSRILETAEKFQLMNAETDESVENKKKIIPSVSFGIFKKDFECKTFMTNAAQKPKTGLGQVAVTVALPDLETIPRPTVFPGSTVTKTDAPTIALEANTKCSDSSMTLDEARRSMKNSIALLRQAQSESSKEVDQLCADTKNISLSEPNSADLDRERKLKSARAIIGNAIQPAKSGVETNLPGTLKTSTASITLKSATLPRRKPTAKTEIQFAIKPHIIDQPAMRFTTEMQHHIPDLRSGIALDGVITSSSNKTALNSRASSQEPKEHIIPIQRTPQNSYTRTSSIATTRSGSLSRQSTIDSESDTTTATNISQSTITNSSQPIKKSPREFIIPIAVEGGGYITPREGSIEPSESNQTTLSSRSTFSRLRPTRRIGSLLVDADNEEGSPFQKLRTTSIARSGDDDDSHFTLHRLRSSRPVKKISHDSQSSGEEDDDDGFEILTAENLFSTLLQRVRALTNRLDVKNDFPNSSRLLSNMRQSRSPFWNHQSQFGSRLNSSVTGVAGKTDSSGLGATWSRSVNRNLDNDMESMFSRTGATLPRGEYHRLKSKFLDQ